MKPVEILTATRAVIEKPEHWTKHTAEATNSKGERCYCLLGALGVVGKSNDLEFSDERAAMDALYDVMPERMGIVGFNDNPDTTHSMVLELIDRAIARAK